MEDGQLRVFRHLPETSESGCNALLAGAANSDKLIRQEAR
jgi:hypothetical protein